VLAKFGGVVGRHVPRLRGRPGACIPRRTREPRAAALLRAPRRGFGAQRAREAWGGRARRPPSCSRGRAGARGAPRPPAVRASFDAGEKAAARTRHTSGKQVRLRLSGARQGCRHGGRQADTQLPCLPVPAAPHHTLTACSCVYCDPASTACLRRAPHPHDMACAHQDEDVGAEGTGVRQRRQLAQAHLVCPQDEIS
jgi:hypothetical protein